MKRVEFLQTIIDNKGYKKYLEIGTYQGSSFFPLSCKRKVAVDPMFKIPLKRKLKWIYKDSSNINNKYFQHTSDAFFEKHSDFLIKFKPELVFVDGLHTFEASLLDVLNSLKYLSKDGLITMHDCMPPNKAASIFANSFKEAIDMKVEGWTGEWTGDVWKTIVYLKKKYEDELDICVFDTDYGLGYVKPIKSINNFDIDRVLFEEINRLKYEDLMRDKSIISLRDKKDIPEVLGI